MKISAMSVLESINIDVVILVLLGIIIVLVLWIIRLEVRINRLLRGKGSKSIEDSINGIVSEIERLATAEKSSLAHLGNLEDRVQRGIRGIHTVRFNPFAGTGSGGNQSFATALIDEQGNGVVISSLYSRDRVSVFSKPIVDHSSEHDLSEEEIEAITQAKGKIQ